MVALLVTLRVVQGFEIIEVDHDQRAERPIAPVHGDRLFETIKQQVAIGKSGERVEQREFLDFASRIPIFGEIGVEQDQVGNISMFSLNRRNGNGLGVFIAVSSPPDHFTLPLSRVSQG